MSHEQARTSEYEPPIPVSPLGWQEQPGQWVVRNQCGSRGGLFVDRTHAIKFAMFESGRRPQAIIMVPGVLELDMSGGPNTVAPPASQMMMTPLRRAA